MADSLKADKSAEIARLVRNQVPFENLREESAAHMLASDAYDIGHRRGLEAAARAMCAYCQHSEHWKPTELVNGAWRHFPVNDAEETLCNSWPIHELLRTLSQPEPLAKRGEMLRGCAEPEDEAPEPPKHL